MVKFSTIEHFLTEENRRSVFPLLFDLYYTKNEEASLNFVPVDDFKKADLAIVPVDISLFFKNGNESELFEFINKANALNIPVWVYTAGDSGITIAQNVVTFRLSGFHSKLNSQTYILPSFVNDPYGGVLNRDWQPLQKADLPTIGFVGNADGSLSKRIKEYLIYLKQSLNRTIKKDFEDKQPFFPSSRIRYTFLKVLENRADVVTDFIFRNKYRAGATTAVERQASTKAFFENIEKNLYTFCIRGAGNFSVRFYETLMMGRIPILINTDCRLPLDNYIDWKQHCVIAEGDNYAEQLLAFHNSKSNTEIVEMQQANRKLALNDLNRINYFTKAADLLIDQTQKYK